METDRGPFFHERLAPGRSHCAILLAHAYQLARIRLASAASPILRLLLQRDHTLTGLHLMRRELEILRAQRQSMPPHRRPDYGPQQRLAIVQLHRLRPTVRPAAAFSALSVPTPALRSVQRDCCVHVPWLT